MGTRSAGLEMEPRRRGDLISKTCAVVRVFEIPSLIGGRAGSYHASGSGPAHQQSSHEGSLGHHFKTGRLALRDAGSSPLRKSQFPGGSRAFGQDWACARFMGERSASGPAGGSWRPARLGCQPASRAAAKIG